MICVGVDNDVMVVCLGINVEWLFFIVFCLGCVFVGLVGVVVVLFFSVMFDMGL